MIKGHTKTSKPKTKDEETKKTLLNLGETLLQFKKLLSPNKNRFQTISHNT